MGSLVGIGQGAVTHPTTHKSAPQQRINLLKMSTEPYQVETPWGRAEKAGTK